MSEIKVTILGCGGSAGVPQIGCDCPTCLSDNPKNKRTRSSLLFRTSTGKNVLIDAGPDFRQQALREKITRIDALVITHIHADHIDGLNELRPLMFNDQRPIDLYITALDLAVLKKRFDFIFKPDPTYPGAPPPVFKIIEILPGDLISYDNLQLRVIQYSHGKMTVTSVAGHGLAYLTDCSEIPAATKSVILNSDHLIIDAIWPGKVLKHHFNFAAALAAAVECGAKQVYLTHMTHHADYEIHNQDLPENVKMSYDGLSITIPTR